MQDIKFSMDNYKFNYRVCGIIEKGDYVLIQNIQGNDFYCLPGGHVEIGEDSTTAIKRELTEELKKPTKNHKLIALIENFFPGENASSYHEIGMYYTAEFDCDMPIEDYVVEENDKGVMKTLTFKWATREQLKDIDLRPTRIKQLIIDKDYNIKHFIHRN